MANGKSENQNSVTKKVNDKISKAVSEEITAAAENEIEVTKKIDAILDFQTLINQYYDKKKKDA